MCAYGAVRACVRACVRMVRMRACMHAFVSACARASECAVYLQFAWREQLEQRGVQHDERLVAGDGQCVRVGHRVLCVGGWVGEGGREGGWVGG